LTDDDATHLVDALKLGDLVVQVGDHVERLS
jgi:hypothetical protein